MPSSIALRWATRDSSAWYDDKIFYKFLELTTQLHLVWWGFDQRRCNGTDLCHGLVLAHSYVSSHRIQRMLWRDVRIPYRAWYHFPSLPFLPPHPKHNPPILIGSQKRTLAKVDDSWTNVHRTREIRWEMAKTVRREHSWLHLLSLKALREVHYERWNKYL